MRTSIAIMAAAGMILGTGAAAYAQGSPSAQQIINSLKPTGTLSTTTRGIRPLAPAAPAAGGVTAPAPAAPAPAAPAAPAMAATTPPPPAAAAPSVDLNVEFATGSAQLTPAATQTLDQLGKALSSATLAPYRFRIEGHTDTVGNAAANQTLSDQRANAVASYLEQKFGVQPSRLSAVGMGERGLLVPTPPQTPEARNRRVQVVNVGT
ncbi:MAG TPA: OmpA family protein [Acetobacteraceae bacterium]|nr:OmpA family protein [Acetobacteraceae bacterium]